MRSQTATVAGTSPLTVRETAGATPVPAKVIGGSSYTPAAGDVVLVVFVRGLYVILGRI